MSVDDQLLNSGQSKKDGADRASQTAGDLREAKRGGGPEMAEPQSLRQAVLQKMRNVKSATANAKENLEKKVFAPISRATARLLRQAWIHLIDSFGLTLIWINIHVFLGKVLGEQLFCHLGEEWLPANLMGSGTQIQTGKAAGKSIGLGEAMILAGLDFCALVILLAIFSIIAMILDVIENPLSHLGLLASFAWHWLVNTIVGK